MLTKQSTTIDFCSGVSIQFSLGYAYHQTGEKSPEKPPKKYQLYCGDKKNRLFIESLEKVLCGWKNLEKSK